MKEFNKELKIKTWVRISDEDKIQKEFLDSDWEDFYWDLVDLDGFVDSLVANLYYVPDCGVRGEVFREPEGFPRFEKPNSLNERFIHKSEELGEIEVVYREVSVDEEEW